MKVQCTYIYTYPWTTVVHDLSYVLMNEYCLFVRAHSTTTWTEFCHFLTPPPWVDSFYTLSVDKNRQISDPPHLVHVVIEWPLICFCGHLHDLEFKVPILQVVLLFRMQVGNCSELHSEKKYYLKNRDFSGSLFTINIAWITVPTANPLNCQFCLIPIKISPNLCDRMVGSKGPDHLVPG